MPSIINRMFRYSYFNANGVIVGINILVFFISEFLYPALPYQLVMIPLRILYDPLYIYTFFTCSFAHANISHLFSNLLGLLIFGSIVEKRIGSKEYILFYFVCSTLSSALSFLSYYLTGQYLIALLGASGALYAVMLLFATFFPNATVFVFGLFPVRAPLLVIFYFFIEFFSSFMNDGISHVTHLFGLIVAFLYIVIRMRIIPFKGRI